MEIKNNIEIIRKRLNFNHLFHLNKSLDFHLCCKSIEDFKTIQEYHGLIGQSFKEIKGDDNIMNSLLLSLYGCVDSKIFDNCINYASYLEENKDSKEKIIIHQQSYFCRKNFILYYKLVQKKDGENIEYDEFNLNGEIHKPDGILKPFYMIFNNNHICFLEMSYGFIYQISRNLDLTKINKNDRCTDFVHSRLD